MKLQKEKIEFEKGAIVVKEDVESREIQVSSFLCNSIVEILNLICWVIV